MNKFFQNLIWVPLLLSSFACATIQPERRCGLESFIEEATSFRNGTVMGPEGARIFVLKDEGACPNAQDSKCVSSHSLSAGDRIVVSRTFKKWICSWDQEPKGREIVGWLPAVSVRVESHQPPPPSSDAWLGKWYLNDGAIEIKQEKKTGKLKVLGDATWDDGMGHINAGSVDGAGVPSGRHLTISDGKRYDCRLSLTLLGDALVASDNAKCTDTNVRFNGIYRQYSHPKQTKTHN